MQEAKPKRRAMSLARKKREGEGNRGERERERARLTQPCPVGRFGSSEDGSFFSGEISMES